MEEYTISGVIVGGCSQIIPDRVQRIRMSKIGNYVKAERRKAGLTQEEFAIRSGLGLRFIRELEQGKETVRLDKVNQALAMFGKEAVPGDMEKENELTMKVDLTKFKTPYEISMELAAKAKEKRIYMKITQQQLSDRSGVSLSAIRRFEKTGEISLASLLKIAWILNSLKEFDGLFEKPEYNSIEEILADKCKER